MLLNKNHNLPLPGRRIAVVGTSGSGKTWLAAELGKCLNLPHIELDALHWQPDWRMCPLDDFRRLVENALNQPGWVIDGNYRKVRDIIWGQSDTLVWLDYPLVIPLWRVLKRTLGRIIRKEVLWGNNRESLKTFFFEKDSLLLWVFTSHPKHRRDYPQLLGTPEYNHLISIRLRSPRQLRGWLAQIQTAQEPSTQQMDRSG